MILILLRYVKPVEEVEAHTPAHREFLQRMYAEGKLICSGPRDPRTGGVILADLDSEVDAMKLVCDDPFFENGIAEYDVIRFNPIHYDPRFAPFIHQPAEAVA